MSALVWASASQCTNHLETSKDLRHRKSSTIGWASLVNCSPQTVSDSCRSVHHCFSSSSQALCFQREGSRCKQRRFLFDNCEVHGYTIAAARIRIIVIARIPPLTGATDLGHVLVSEPLLPLELADALCAGRKVNLCGPRIVLCVSFVIHGWRSSTCAATRFRIIVIARVPPLTSATVPRHAMVNRVVLGVPRSVLCCNVVVHIIRMRVQRKLVPEYRWAATACGAPSRRRRSTQSEKSTPALSKAKLYLLSTQMGQDRISSK